MTPEVPLRLISLRVVLTSLFFIEFENKGISQYVATPQRHYIFIYVYNILNMVLLVSY
ncbi:hypothetical protein GIB67_024273 [Kingdonia uniflora]|uniref:Uncharacterized protein n=1 Tax=Kingdonia uniflora TaxID=39325 RepID=A0A7J7LZZ6_9MAGN|nr:hypothetical protein GIB67_024273 [Kingdonia uniflora]